MSDPSPIPILHYETLGSTNDEAMALARSGAGGPVFVVAEKQTGGRGRHGRVWSSPPGNLYASLLLIDPAPLACLPQLGFVAGVALARTLRVCLAGDDRLKLKWPNDILFNGAKLSGILLESTTLPNGRLACVIGFGVNCVSHPDTLAYPATNLALAGRAPIDPCAVLDALAPNIQIMLETWDRGAGFTLVRSAWLAIAAGLGDMITVTGSSRTVTGRFDGLDSTGRALVETADGLVAIDAGDVFLHGGLQDNDKQAGRSRAPISDEQKG